jgi:hypothetical protein
VCQSDANRMSIIGADRRSPMPSCKFDCFLTHDWGEDELGRDNHACVSKVYVRLKDAGLRPWFDEEFMRGDVNKTMMDALGNSACAVVFITRRYVEKASGDGPNGATARAASPSSVRFSSEWLSFFHLTRMFRIRPPLCERGGCHKVTPKWMVAIFFVTIFGGKHFSFFDNRLDFFDESMYMISIEIMY